MRNACIAMVLIGAAVSDKIVTWSNLSGSFATELRRAAPKAIRNLVAMLNLQNFGQVERWQDAAVSGPAV